jgi:fumarate hydratase class II
MAEFRTEQDSMGSMQVPAGAYWGAQTARAAENFPISGLRFPREFIRMLGLIKKHASEANRELGLLAPDVAGSIAAAAQEVADGKWDGEFILDIFQTGSGTSTNMNANEVIANRACELKGGSRGDRSVHPNDHVNRGQSSNDVIPTAIQLAAMHGLVHELLPELDRLADALDAKKDEFHDVLKIGRTHLQDATPIRLGQEFGGYAAQARNAAGRVSEAAAVLSALPLGGTAVGTGINTHPEFARKVIEKLSSRMNLNLHEAENHFAAQASIDALVTASAALRSVALAMVKIANDIRLLGSGPRCGIGELKLPAVQPGSSIMPGKVNPVMSEMLIQVSAQVIGNDATIAFSATCGAFELNTMLPVAAHNLLESIRILTSGCHVFRERCVEGIDADRAACEGYIERSLAICTALVPEIGYDRAAAIAKEAYRTGRTVRQVALEQSGLDEQTIARLLDPARQAGGKEASHSAA